MSERVGDVEGAGVVPAVADEQSFAVDDVAVFAGEVQVRRGVLDTAGQGFGQSARRIDVAEQHVGQARTDRLPEERGIEDRGCIDHRDVQRTTVTQDDDGARICREHPHSQRDLVGGQVDGGAVESFGLLTLAESEEQDHGVGRFGKGDRLVGQQRCGIRTGGVAGCERDLAAGTGTNSIDRCVDAGGVHMRRSTALVAGFGGQRADDGNAVVRAEREQVAVVAQQHHGLRSDLPGQAVVGIEIDGAGIGYGRGCVAGLDRQVDHAARGDQQVAGRQRAIGHRGGDLRVAGFATERHRQVESGGDGTHPVGDRTPVADHQAVETPVLAQDRGQQFAVLERVDAVDLVVRAHHRPGRCGAHHVPEGAQVQLVQAAFIDVGADPHAVGLLIVGGEMLERGTHAAGLHAVDEGCGHMSGEQRVLGEVLEVAAAEGRAFEVDAGAEDNRHPLRAGLVGDGVTGPARQVRVPCLGQGDRRWKAGGGHAAGDAEMVAGAFLLA